MNLICLHRQDRLPLKTVENREYNEIYNKVKHQNIHVPTDIHQPTHLPWY